MKKIILIIAIITTLSGCNRSKGSGNTDQSTTESTPEIIIEKKGTTILGNIQGLEDERIRLAYYFLDKTYIRDSTNAAPDGSFMFNDEYADGLYLITFNNNRNSFQLILNQEKEIAFEATHSNGETVVEFLNSTENQLLHQYLGTLASKNREGSKKDDGIGMSKSLEEKVLPLDQIDGLKEDAERARITKSILDNRSLFVSDIVRASLPMAAPPPCEERSAEDCELYQYLYRKQHYFDRINLKDPRMLRTPFWHKAINTYLDDITLEHPYFIIREIDHLADIMRPSPEVFKHFIISQVNKYSESKLVYAKYIYAHIVRNYYETGEATWADDATKSNMITAANRTETPYVGEQVVDFPFVTFSGMPGTLLTVPNKATVLHVSSSKTLEGASSGKLFVLEDLRQFFKSRGEDIKVISVYPVMDEGRRREVKDYLLIDRIDPNEIPAFLDPADYQKLTDFLGVAPNTAQLLLLDADKKIMYHERIKDDGRQIGYDLRNCTNFLGVYYRMARTLP